MQGVKARKTQKFLHRLGELSSTANPMANPVQVEGNQFFSVSVGQWIVGAQLLHKAAIPGTLVVSSHNAIKRPVGAATQSKAYGYVASMVGFAEKSCCREITG